MHSLTPVSYTHLTLAVAIPGDIPPDEVPLAVDAANACPVGAIRVE